MKKYWLWIFFVISIISIILFVVFNFFVQKPTYKELAERYSAEFGLETSLVLAIIQSESSYKPTAVSKSGAIGLMQIIPKTGKWIAESFGEHFTEDVLFDPETNIKYGCFYLKYLFDKFNEEDIVICAYNAGEGKVTSWLDENGKLDKELIDYDETKKYLERVLSYKEIYK